MKKFIAVLKGFIKGVFDSVDSGKVTGCCGGGSYLIEMERKAEKERAAKKAAAKR